MTEPTEPPAPAAPLVTRSRRRVSLVWLVPVVAALIGLSMLVNAWISKGPEITISFPSAAGLEAGKTPVKYKDVVVGTVSAIALSEDATHVVATVSLARSALNLTRRDTRFWIVRPRVGLGGISGLDTLLSGVYISVDAGTAAETSDSFTGLTAPPVVIGGTPGRIFILRSGDLGSLDIGAPVYFRRIQVGRVASFRLSEDGKGITLQIFVDAPYDGFVTADTRFWNASGVDISLGTNGLMLRSQSMATIVAGGIAFATPDGATTPTPAPALAEFNLAADQQTAMSPPEGPARRFVLRFAKPLRGLSPGAAVQFAGVDVGRVVSVDLDFDTSRYSFPTVVAIDVHTRALGGVLARLPSPLQNEQQIAHFLTEMVAHGLRAQARTGNILTGQLYIALDMIADAPPAQFDATVQPSELPTMDGSFDQMQEQVMGILAKLNGLPLESIGHHVDSALASLDALLQQANASLLPEATRTLNQVNRGLLPEATRMLRQSRESLGAVQGLLTEDAPLQQNLAQTLQELQRTTRSLRALTDLLSRQPESLLRGRRDSR